MVEPLKLVPGAKREPAQPETGGPFKIGDVVKLASGGPKLTVRLVDKRTKRVSVDWMADDLRYTEDFHPAMLRLAPDDDQDDTEEDETEETE